MSVIAAFRRTPFAPFDGQTVNMDTPSSPAESVLESVLATPSPRPVWSSPGANLGLKRRAAARFPLNRCSHNGLRDSQRSINVGLRSAIGRYNELLVNLQFQEPVSHSWSLPSVPSPPISVTSPDSDDSGGSLFESSDVSSDISPEDPPQDPPDTPEQEELPKSLLKSWELVENANVERVRAEVKALIKECMGDAPDEEINTYVINNIIADPNDYYSQILKTGTVKAKSSLFDDIRLLYVEKHFNKHMDQLYDDMVETLVLDTPASDLYNPDWYKMYSEIWKFDSHECLTLQEDFYKDTYMRNSYAMKESFTQEYMHSLPQCAYLMNVEKFRFYYIRENHKVLSVFPLKLEPVPEQRLNARVIVGRRSTPVVSFSDRVSVREFARFDPPCASG